MTRILHQYNCIPKWLLCISMTSPHNNPHDTQCTCRKCFWQCNVDHMVCIIRLCSLGSSTRILHSLFSLSTHSFISNKILTRSIWKIDCIHHIFRSKRIFHIRLWNIAVRLGYKRTGPGKKCTELFNCNCNLAIFLHTFLMRCQKHKNYHRLHKRYVCIQYNLILWAGIRC